MKFKFKYISWIFDIRVWIAIIITVVIEGTIETWVFNNYGITFRSSGFSISRSILGFILLGVIGNITDKIFDKIKCFNKNI
jgi:hypothetical protein